MTPAQGPGVTLSPCLDAYVRLGVLEDEERAREVVPGQADQILSEQGFSCTFSLTLTPVQEWNHPLEGVLHVALGPGLMRERSSLLKLLFQSLENSCFKLHHIIHCFKMTCTFASNYTVKLASCTLRLWKANY